MDFFLNFFVDTAWAQTGAAQGGGWSTLLFIGLLVVFYFLLIRPQQKKQKEHRQMVDTLGVGDEIVTGGGILGKVTEVGDQFLTVEVAERVTVKVQRHTVATVLPKGSVKNA
jgi:preprotein translocase subunit YajC